MPKNAIAERCTAPASSSSTAAHDAGEREVAAAAGDLVDREPAATRPHREVDRGEDLVVGSIVVVQVPDEELGGRDAARDRRAGDLELGVERERDRGQLGGGVGVGDRAADGAAVADLEVADHAASPGEQRHRLDRRFVVLGLGLAGHRPDREGPVRALDAAQLVDPVEVDDVLEAGEAQRQHRHEALAAGEHLGVVAVLGEQRRDVGDRLGRVVLERAGFMGDSQDRTGQRRTYRGRHAPTPHVDTPRAR